MPERETPAQVGKSEGSAEPDCEYPAAVLWVPDPTTRRGWCEWWVRRKEPERRPVGFNRGKAKNA